MMRKLGAAPTTAGMERSLESVLNWVGLLNRT